MAEIAYNLGGYAIRDYPLGKVIPLFPQSPAPVGGSLLVRGFGTALGVIPLLIPSTSGLDVSENQWWNRFKNYASLLWWEVPLQLCLDYPIETFSAYLLPRSLTAWLGIDITPVAEAEALATSR